MYIYILICTYIYISGCLHEDGKSVKFGWCFLEHCKKK